MNMKQKCINILVTTALSYIVLSLAFAFSRQWWMHIPVHLWAILAANVLIHLGLWVTEQFESKYFIVELVLDIVFTSIVVVSFGLFLGWINSMGSGVLVGVVVIVHLLSRVLEINRQRAEADQINTILQKRNSKGKRKRKNQKKNKDE